ncbi:MAG: hypothetical protein GY769_17615 [bacterium]|nr:hypothetical protein [bacterium]
MKEYQATMETRQTLTGVNSVTTTVRVVGGADEAERLVRNLYDVVGDVMVMEVTDCKRCGDKVRAGLVGKDGLCEDCEEEAAKVWADRNAELDDECYLPEHIQAAMMEGTEEDKDEDEDPDAEFCNEDGACSECEADCDFAKKDDDPEACPGCGCKPGDGKTEGCDDPDGCGFNA